MVAWAGVLVSVALAGKMVTSPSWPVAADLHVTTGSKQPNADDLAGGVSPQEGRRARDTPSAEHDVPVALQYDVRIAALILDLNPIKIRHRAALLAIA
jgi:hypothetical protein